MKLRAMSINNTDQSTSYSPQNILDLLKEHWMIWGIPMLLCMLAAAYFAFQPRNWQASQSLVVRDDMVGESFKPGRFESLDSMKTAQETILHVAREPMVVRNALERIGSPSGNKNWLEGSKGLECIEQTQENIAIVAPNGAEFGKTEVIVLQVKAKSSERAGKLVTALLDEIESNLRSIRSQRLASMQSELKHALDLAEEDYTKFADSLQSLEREIGPDLPTLLGMLNDAQSNNDIQIALENVRGAIRSAAGELDLTTKQLEVLQRTQQNPEALVATPNELLEASPALRRLKDGLVDLQLKLSDLLGRFEEAHPTIAKSRFAIEETKRQIRSELSTAIHGLQAQLEIRQSKVDRLSTEEEHYESRLLNLTNNRVRYATLSSQAEKRNDTLAAARDQFAEIKSLQRAAESVDLMSRLDKPFVSSRPLGPGKSTILGGGMLGGMLLGLGLLMFFSAPGSAVPLIQPPRRRSDYPTRNVADLPTSNDSQHVPANAMASDGREPAQRPIQAVKQLDTQTLPQTPVLATVPPVIPNVPNVPDVVQAQDSIVSNPGTGQVLNSLQGADINPSLSSIANSPVELPATFDNSDEIATQTPEEPKNATPTLRESQISIASQAGISAAKIVAELKKTNDRSPGEIGLTTQNNPDTESPKLQPQRMQTPPTEEKQRLVEPTQRLTKPTVIGDLKRETPPTELNTEVPASPDNNTVIDLSTFRAEMDLQLPQSDSPSTQKSDKVRNQAQDNSTQNPEGDSTGALPEPNPPTDFNSLHERIKKLTDPNQTTRRSMNPDE